MTKDEFYSGGSQVALRGLNFCYNKPIIMTLKGAALLNQFKGLAYTS